MSLYSIYYVLLIFLLVGFTPHVKSQTKTAPDTTVTSFNSESSTSESSTVSEIVTAVSVDSNTLNATENTNTTSTTENSADDSRGRGNIIRECGCNEHLGYICGCGERCPYPDEFGIGPVCPQYCLETLTCVCNEGYGRDYETNLCVLCPEYYYYK